MLLRQGSHRSTPATIHVNGHTTKLCKDAGLIQFGRPLVGTGGGTCDKRELTPPRGQTTQDIRCRAMEKLLVKLRHLSCHKNRSFTKQHGSIS